MIWLRSTGYGEIYPVTVLDENDKPFETEVDLSSLKFKKLPIEPDGEALFAFQLPVSKSVVKFKLLTIIFLASLLQKIPILPVPQYKSYTTSLPVSSAKLRVTWYKLSACFELV